MIYDININLYTHALYKYIPIQLFSHCFINIDICVKAMEPVITVPTLHPITILGTRTIFFAYLKNISKNYL